LYLEKATLIENKKEVSKSHWLDQFVSVPEPLKFVNVVYTVRVEGRTLEKYKGN